MLVNLMINLSLIRKRIKVSTFFGCNNGHAYRIWRRNHTRRAVVQYVFQSSVA